MIRKITALILSLLMLIMTFSACSKKETTGRAFGMAVSELPRHFDPQIASVSSERTVALNIFDGLFKQNENGEAVPCCAESYSVSGETYTFKIKNGLKYYLSSAVLDFLEEKGKTVDGAVTAEDFAFGITRGVLPETQAADFELLSIIKNARKVHSGELSADSLGVRAIDKSTLEITLESGTREQLLYALTQPISFPCDEEFFQITAGRYGLEKKYIISNGSFYLSSVNEGKSVGISANPEYIGAFAPVPSSVRLYLNLNETDGAKKVNKNTYDCGFFSSTEAQKELNRSVNKAYMPNICRALAFNTQKEAMKNVNLRAGLSMAVEISAVTDEPLSDLVPPYYKLSGGTVESLGYNPESAREKMKTAYGELKIDNLTVELLCTEADEKTAKLIVNSWQKNIGVELNGTVKAVTYEDFNKLLSAGEYDAVIYPYSADSDSGADFLSLFKTDNEGNVTGYSSEEYDRLLSVLMSAQSTENAAACQSYLLKNAVILPIKAENTVFATADGTEGLYFCSKSSNVYFYKGQKK